MFRCIVRYGYKDVMEGPQEFEEQLVKQLKEFVHREHYILENNAIDQQITTAQVVKASKDPSVQLLPLLGEVLTTGDADQCAEEDMQFIEKAMDKGVVYLLGET
ncbi:hypothetical protein Sjap_005928 [Stephania japonica]|uniref:Uncharacterized protein n=1 Tax=Stephania japonica TaxID=461633 RepID=A0AAP0K7F7_9MAGN